MTDELIIDRRYKVFKSLAGGMGQVYFCFDVINDNFPVAIKTIRLDLLPTSFARSKFLREANIWIHLGNHPNVVKAYGVQYIPEKHETYIVTELVQPPQGLTDPSLRSWLQNGDINFDRAMKFGLHMIRGMRYATTKIPDLVHRDLKPENILIGMDEIAKIHDFGIASSLTSEIPGVDGNLSRFEGNKTHSFIGTLYYMSPEQCMAQPLDCRSDIYAFGLILYELITGRMVITEQNPRDVVLSHLGGFPTKKVEKNIKDQKIKDFILDCVCTNKDSRFQNWNEVEKKYLVLYESFHCMASSFEEYPIEKNHFDTYQVINSYIAIGVSYLDAGETDKAKKFIQKALELSEKFNVPHLQAVALSNLGLIASQIGSYDQAIQYLKTAESINSNLLDLANQAICLGNLGGVYQKIGEIELARDYFTKSLVIAKSENIASLQAAQLGNLAISFMEMADYQKAILLYTQAIEILSECNAEISLATNLGNLGNVLFLLGDIDAAENNYQRAYDIAFNNGLRPQISVALGTLANINIAKRDYDGALLKLEEAASISKEIGDRSGLCKHLGMIATVHGYRKEYQEAIIGFKEALFVAEEINDLSSKASLHLGVGNLHVERGNLFESISAFEKCIEICTRINDRNIEASSHGNLGKVYAALFRFDDAIEHLVRSLDIAKEIGLLDTEGRAAWTIGVIFELLEKEDLALDYMKHAVKIFRERNLPEYEQAVIHLSEFNSRK
jgi:serine/threonine protein kinase